MIGREVDFHRVHDLVGRADFAGLRALIRSGWNVNQQEHHTGETALLVACRLNRTKLVELLLRGGADPDLCHNDGYNCYDSAKNARIKRLLVAYGFGWQPREWSEGSGRATMRWMSARHPVDDSRELAFTDVDIWVEHQLRRFPPVRGTALIRVHVDGTLRYASELSGPGHDRLPVLRVEHPGATVLTVRFVGFRGDLRARVFCAEAIAGSSTPGFWLPDWDS